MKKIKLIALILASNYLCLSGYASDAQDVFYQAFNFAKNESPFSQQLNWNDIETKALEFIGNEEIICRGTSAIANILAPALNKYDFHSLVTEQGLGSTLCPNYHPDELSQYWSDFIQLNDAARSYIQETTSHFWGKRYGDIAYIYVPSGYAFSHNEVNARIMEGRNLINELDLDTAAGVIVDFRLNGGGNYFPMLLSLSKLITPGTLFSYSNGERIHLSEDGNTLAALTADGLKVILHQIDHSPPVNRVNIPIVLLVDEGTGSSGAITAFALKENSSTSHILGERTSPTLSVNASLELKDGNYFNLMILRMVSADGIEQPLYLDIDTRLEHNFYSMFKPEDKSIKQAIQFLNQPN